MSFQFLQICVQVYQIWNIMTSYMYMYEKATLEEVPSTTHS